MLAIPDDAWCKSSRSSGASNCIEVAHQYGRTAVRDSKNTTGPVLTFTDRQWHAFLDGVTAASAYCSHS